MSLQLFLDGKAKLAARGLSCLNEHWQGSKDSYYQFRCSHGHSFERHGAIFSFGGPKECPVCRAQARIVQLQAQAAENGVKCLDTQWAGSHARYQFECGKGHTWSREAGRAKCNMRCPVCSHKVQGEKIKLQDGLQRLQEAARKRGGQCLSDAYEGGQVPYKFRCSAGHEWQSVGSDILRGSWCLRCAHQEKSTRYRLADGLQRLQTSAQARGGRCLSTCYEGGKRKHQFVCAKGHQWEAPGARVLRGAWCPQCAHDSKRFSIDVAHQAAHDRGGQCLSAQYVSSLAKLEWMCDRGHVWQAALGTIRQGHWCPQCAVMARIRKPNSTAWAKYI